MDNDIRASRIASLQRYLANEKRFGSSQQGDDSKIYSLFLNWYTEPYMQGSRIRTVALAKRMLAELRMEEVQKPAHYTCDDCHKPAVEAKLWPSGKDSDDAET